MPFFRISILVLVSWLLVAAAPAVGQDDFERVRYGDPEGTADLGVGLWAWPLPMDYDEDGDFDLVVSTRDVPFNGIYFFENPTGEAFPVFEPPVRLGNGIRDVQVSHAGGEARVLVPGAELVDFRARLGAERRPLLTPDAALADIENERFNQWKLVDYEGDGDLDLVVGVDDWGDYGWDNAFDDAGQWTNGPLHGYVHLFLNENGTYVDQGRLRAGGEVIDVYGAPTPNFADFDGDGDLDLITGEFLDRFTWFENVGTRSAPAYAPGRFLENADGVLKMDLEMIIPASLDWDRDGDVDLIVGDEDGRVAFVENTGAVVDRMPVFAAPRYFRQRAQFLKFGALATPVSVDWDGDGDEDLIAGNTAGRLAFIENLDGGDPPRWAEPRLLRAGGEEIRIQAGENGSIQGPAEAKWGYTAPSVADWNGDGRLDIVVNSIWGRVVWYPNVGTKTEPRLGPARPVRVAWPGAPPKPAWTWWTPEEGTLATQWRTTPHAIDWNEDGLTDLVMLDHEGYLSFFERFERDDALFLKPGRRIFFGADASGYDSRHRVTDDAPGLLQLNTGLHGKSGRRKFTFVDWDGDGDRDLLVNSENVSLLRNEGVDAEGRVRLVDAGTLGERRLAGHTTSPTIVDWNRDGVSDLLVGAEDGHVYYLQNPRSN